MQASGERVLRNRLYISIQEVTAKPITKVTIQKNTIFSLNKDVVSM
jgi:hypothetical protein